MSWYGNHGSAKPSSSGRTSSRHGSPSAVGSNFSSSKSSHHHSGSGSHHSSSRHGSHHGSSHHSSSHHSSSHHNSSSKHSLHSAAVHGSASKHGFHSGARSTHSSSLKNEFQPSATVNPDPWYGNPRTSARSGSGSGSGHGSFSRSGAPHSSSRSGSSHVCSSFSASTSRPSFSSGGGSRSTFVCGHPHPPMPVMLDAGSSSLPNPFPVPERCLSCICSSVLGAPKIAHISANLTQDLTNHIRNLKLSSTGKPGFRKQLEYLEQDIMPSGDEERMRMGISTLAVYADTVRDLKY